MKMIIDGKRYDTETAEVVASWDTGLPRSDFTYEEETLYRTVKGTWFLHGKGGAMSQYGRGTERERWGGEEIIPMTDDEAREWLELRGETKSIEKWFADSFVDA